MTTTPAVPPAQHEPEPTPVDGEHIPARQPQAAPEAPVFLDASPQQPTATAHVAGGELAAREPLARNVEDFRAHLGRIVTELTDLAGRHPGLGPLQPREFTSSTHPDQQAGFNLADIPLTYHSWEPRAGWIPARLTTSMSCCTGSPTTWPAAWRGDSPSTRRHTQR